MMTHQVTHCWEPSERLIALMERTQNEESILAKELSDQFIDNALIEERFRGKIKSRALNGLKRGVINGYYDGMTWNDFINDMKKPYSESKFSFIREVGQVSFDEIKKALGL